ncbi:MAG: redox-regulated ATPase YchF [Saprospiraceae bacterium]|nr:redox-regulated ATPase YchF [Saprospiraceae bacterium]
MALKCGIVGLPNVGKSTLFNALTSAKALAANYPFAAKDPNVGIVTVPDRRLDILTELTGTRSTVPTTIEIVDIAGLIKGASKGEGLGNQFLANIREVNAIVHVLRCFEDDNIVHVDGSVNPTRDKEIIDYELIFKDLETVEKAIEKYKKQAKSGNKDDARLTEIAESLKVHLEAGKSARTFNWDDESEAMFRQFFLLTAKPVLYVCNVDEAAAINGNKYVEEVRKLVQPENAEVIVVCAGIEAEIAELDSLEERAEFLESMGLPESGTAKLIHACYKLLDLITYFTAGEKEVRAWTIRKGTKAPGAAGVIHSDFERGFIRAEVIKFDDYEKYRSEAAIKEAGKMNVEGKDYVVADGDVMHFRFNV